GLIVWKGESPNTFSKIVYLETNEGNRQFEHIVTQNGDVNPGIPESITPAPADLPEEGYVLIRARYDGSKVIAEFSGDEGASWTLIGAEGHGAPFEGPMRVGLTAFRNSSASSG